MGEDLANIVTAGAEDGENRVADAALPQASGQASVGLEMPDLRLDGASSPEEPRKEWRNAASRADDQVFTPWPP